MRIYYLATLATVWLLHWLATNRGFLLAVLPPGAFIGLGLLIAGKKWLDNRATSKSVSIPIIEAEVEPKQA